MNKRQDAKRNLVWYFQLMFEQTGTRFDGDNRAEIEDIVDLIIDAAKEELKKEEA